MHNALRGNKKTKGICELLGLAPFTPPICGTARLSAPPPRSGAPHRFLGS
jgi:hypothetical protein